jgi:hypothetical protein
LLRASFKKNIEFDAKEYVNLKNICPINYFMRALPFMVKPKL